MELKTNNNDLRTDQIEVAASCYFGAKDFYGYAGGTAAGFTLSGGGGFNSGFSLIAGYEFQAGAGRSLKETMDWNSSNKGNGDQNGIERYPNMAFILIFFEL